MRSAKSQRFQPAAFRVAPVSSVGGESTSGEIRELLDELVGALRQPPEQPDDADEPVAGTATSIWRIGQRHERMMEALAGEAPKSVKYVRTALQMASETLKANEIEIMDFRGRPYDVGMPPRVVGKSEAENLSVRTVSQTVLPTVYFRGRLIQRGEIVVGVPASQEEGE